MHANGEQARNALTRVERTRLRLDRGSYGWCALCGGRISERRLTQQRG